jgi:phenylpyruvate tautomerase PptA (4-oxalocrotonate tautomerase family)
MHPAPRAPPRLPPSPDPSTDRYLKADVDPVDVAAHHFELLGGGTDFVEVVENTPKGRLSLEERRALAETLTDAVLVPEVGVIERVLAAMTEACGLPEPSPAWWVNFRVIDEGSWGSSGGVLSVLSLLDSGVFTEEKVKAIRTALDA